MIRTEIKKSKPIQFKNYNKTQLKYNKPILQGSKIDDSRDTTEEYEAKVASNIKQSIKLHSGEVKKYFGVSGKNLITREKSTELAFKMLQTFSKDRW